MKITVVLNPDHLTSIKNAVFGTVYPMDYIPELSEGGWNCSQEIMVACAMVSPDGVANLFWERDVHWRRDSDGKVYLDFACVDDPEFDAQTIKDFAVGWMPLPPCPVAKVEKPYSLVPTLEEVAAAQGRHLNLKELEV